MDPIFGLLTN